MLGATHTGAVTRQPISIPPLLEGLAENGRRDWKTGVELIKTCMDTHDTARCVSSTVVELFGVNGGGGGGSVGCRLRLYTLECQVMGWTDTILPLLIGIFVVLSMYLKRPDILLPDHIQSHRKGEFSPYDARYMLRYLLLPSVLPSQLTNS
jgi:hypothetical protein